MWVVAIRGNARGKSAADNLGEVGLGTPRIASRDDYAAHSIAGAVPETPFAGLEETRILMQQRRKHRARHEVLDCAVGRGSPETLPVSGRTLAIAGLTVFCLADACEKSVPGILNVVKRAPRYDLKLLSRGERWNLVRVLQCQKVGQRKKEPVLRGAADLPLAVFPLSILAFVAFIRRLCRLR